MYRDRTVNVYHYSFQGVTAYRLERSYTFLTVWEFSMSVFACLRPPLWPETVMKRTETARNVECLGTARNDQKRLQNHIHVHVSKTKELL